MCNNLVEYKLIGNFLRYPSDTLHKFHVWIEGRKGIKNGYFTVRLTASVYPPSYGQLFVIFLGLRLRHRFRLRLPIYLIRILFHLKINTEFK